MPRDLKFSARHGYTRPEEALYTGELPVDVRTSILEILQWYADPKLLWGRIQDLFKRSGSGQGLLRALLDVPGAKQEENSASNVRRFLGCCPWYLIYDIIEDVVAQLELRANAEAAPAAFERDINEYFVRSSIGWRLVEGRIVVRGSEALKDAVGTAATELRTDQRSTAAKHIQDALQALSQRPEPNLRGAIVHGVSALECVAREISGEPAASLEEIIRQNSNLLPRSLDAAVCHLWAYANKQGLIWGRSANVAWDLEERRQPSREEAEMVVGLAAVISTYLTRKNRAPAH